MKRTRVLVAVVVGLAFLALAAYYWMTPAGSLPAFLPGHEAGVTSVHIKHGLAALILGVLVLLYGWFASAPKQ